MCIQVMGRATLRAIRLAISTILVASTRIDEVLAVEIAIAQVKTQLHVRRHGGRQSSEVRG